jgi:hypothetical protein
MSTKEDKFWWDEAKRLDEEVGYLMDRVLAAEGHAPRDLGSILALLTDMAVATGRISEREGAEWRERDKAVA